MSGNASKVRLHIRQALEGRDLGYPFKVTVRDTMGSTSLLVFASVDGGPVEVFEVHVRLVDRPPTVNGAEVLVNCGSCGMYHKGACPP